MPDIFYLYMDRSLSPARVKKLKYYLAKHKSCCRHFEFEIKLRRAIRRRQLAVRASRKLKTKIRRKLSIR